MTITKERAIEILDRHPTRIGGWLDVIDALDAAGAFDAPKSAGLMTRARAARLVVDLDAPQEATFEDGAAALLDALERAGAFGDGSDTATLTEIADVARTILAIDDLTSGRGESDSLNLGPLALRLATACRKAGLVKP